MPSDNPGDAEQVHHGEGACGGAHVGLPVRGHLEEGLAVRLEEADEDLGHDAPPTGRSRVPVVLKSGPTCTSASRRK
jgi:hypothetical protein